MQSRELIIYRELMKERLFSGMVSLMYSRRPDEAILEDKTGLFYDCMHELMDIGEKHGFYGNLWHCYLTNLLVNHENPFSLACEMRGDIQGSLNEAVMHDMTILKGYFDYDLNGLLESFGREEWKWITDFQHSDERSRIYNSRIRSRICELTIHFEKSSSPDEMKENLTEFYKEYGVGKFGLHKGFRIIRKKKQAEIIPITNIAHVFFDNLVGYEIQKQKLRENTEAFVSGRKANNCLLYGDAGTGKSSCIKAIINEYFDRGLRIIELYKHQFRELPEVISQIKNRNYKFILFMDDLSFEEFEIDYKYLKAVIEGGLEKKPDNILIYATSNRRHLVREKVSDKLERDEELHTNDTVQEKLSLAYRFGVQIYFGRPEKKEFQEIVRTLAAEDGIKMEDEELMLEANRWELSHGGLSGRTARQFVDYLLGKG